MACFREEVTGLDTLVYSPFNWILLSGPPNGQQAAMTPFFLDGNDMPRQE
jgi:hypothetical protein